MVLDLLVAPRAAAAGGRGRRAAPRARWATSRPTTTPTRPSSGRSCGDEPAPPPDGPRRPPRRAARRHRAAQGLGRRPRRDARALPQALRGALPRRRRRRGPALRRARRDGRPLLPVVGEPPPLVRPVGVAQRRARRPSRAAGAASAAAGATSSWDAPARRARPGAGPRCRWPPSAPRTSSGPTSTRRVTAPATRPVTPPATAPATRPATARATRPVTAPVTRPASREARIDPPPADRGRGRRPPLPPPARRPARPPRRSRARSSPSASPPGASRPWPLAAAGLLLLLAGHLPLWVRTQTTAPGGATPAHEDVWAPVEDDWLERVDATSRSAARAGTRRPGTSRTGSAASRSSASSSLVAALAFLVGTALGPDALFRVAVAAPLLFVPLWLNGMRTTWNPSELRKKGEALAVARAALDEAAGKDFDLVPLARAARGPARPLPRRRPAHGPRPPARTPRASWACRSRWR